MAESDYVFEEPIDSKRTYKYEKALEVYQEIKQKKPELVSQLDFIESMGESTPNFSNFD